MQTTKWTKVLPPLSDEQRRISDDFVHYWHEVLPRRFGFVERFNHGYPVVYAPDGFHRTLEIGPGLGEHLEYERLTPEQEASQLLRPGVAGQHSLAPARVLSTHP